MSTSGQEHVVTSQDISQSALIQWFSPEQTLALQRFLDARLDTQFNAFNSKLDTKLETFFDRMERRFNDVSPSVEFSPPPQEQQPPSRQPSQRQQRPQPTQTPPSPHPTPSQPTQAPLQLAPLPAPPSSLAKQKEHGDSTSARGKMAKRANALRTCQVLHQQKHGAVSKPGKYAYALGPYTLELAICELILRDSDREKWYTTALIRGQQQHTYP